MASPETGSIEGESAEVRSEGTPAETDPWSPAVTALIVIDPYNDFLAPPGKSWLLTRRTLGSLGTVDHLRLILEAAREAGVIVCFAPHARYTPETYRRRRFFNPSIFLANLLGVFRRDAWGGRFHRDLTATNGELVATEHLTSSGFVGTDLHDLLAGRGVRHVVLCGCLSNTCVESTARSAIESGYRVTIASDAIAAMSPRDHAAAIESGYPQCAHRVLPARAIASGWGS